MKTETVILGAYLAFVLLNTLDVITTIYALQGGLAEANMTINFMAAELGLAAVWIVKLVIYPMMLFGCIILCNMREERLVRIFAACGLVALCAWYLVVFINNSWQLLSLWT